jgi:hypothetical protein
MNGIALTVMISQLPTLFGFSIDAIVVGMLVDPNQEMIGLGAANLAAGLVTRELLKIREVEARGVEPLSSSLSAQTSTRLSGDKF